MLTDSKETSAVMIYFIVPELNNGLKELSLEFGGVKVIVKPGLFKVALIPLPLVSL